MDLIFSIYKFHIPFLDNYLNKKIYDELIYDIKFAFLNIDRIINIIKNENEKYIMNSIEFDSWKIIIYYNKDKNNYFIPIIKLDFYLDKKANFNELFWKDFIDIYYELWINDFIFSNKNIFLNNKDIITIDFLKIQFEKFWENKLEFLIKNINKDLINEEIESNKNFKYFLYFLMILNFNFYESIRNNINQIKEIDSIMLKNNYLQYNAILDLSKTRLNEIENISLINFKKYNSFLEKVFWLFR